MSIFYIGYVKLFLLWFVLQIVNIATVLVVSIIPLCIDFIILLGRTLDDHTVQTPSLI